MPTGQGASSVVENPSIFLVVNDSTGLRKYPAGIWEVQLVDENEEGGLYVFGGHGMAFSRVPVGQ